MYSRSSRCCVGRPSANSACGGRLLLHVPHRRLRRHKKVDIASNESRLRQRDSTLPQTNRCWNREGDVALNAAPQDAPSGREEIGRKSGGPIGPEALEAPQVPAPSVLGGRGPISVLTRCRRPDKGAAKAVVDTAPTLTFDLARVTTMRSAAPMSRFNRISDHAEINRSRVILLGKKKGSD
jgi:hypothetical protein